MKQYLTLLLIALIGLVGCNQNTNPETASQNKKGEQKTLSTDQEKSNKKRIMFFGNSLTAGYGLEEGEDFPSIIRNRIDSLGMDYDVINAGLSGETTSNGLERISWVLREPVDIFVLELGANDMLRGTSVAATHQNLRSILDVVNEKSPGAKIIVAGMQALPNMGADYGNVFNAIFPSLAKEYKGSLIPFFLDGVAGIEELNLPDRKHPNIEGQKIVAENVWEVLQPLL